MVLEFSGDVGVGLDGEHILEQVAPTAAACGHGAYTGLRVSADPDPLDAQPAPHQFDIILEVDSLGQLADSSQSKLARGIRQFIHVISYFFVRMRDLHGRHRVAEHGLRHKHLKPKFRFFVDLPDLARKWRGLFRRQKRARAGRLETAIPVLAYHAAARFGHGGPHLVHVRLGNEHDHLVALLGSRGLQRPNILKFEPVRQYVIHSAGRAIEVGMSDEDAYLISNRGHNHAPNNPARLYPVELAVDDRVMRRDQACSPPLGLSHHFYVHVESEQHLVYRGSARGLKPDIVAIKRHERRRQLVHYLDETGERCCHVDHPVFFVCLRNRKMNNGPPHNAVITPTGISSPNTPG